ncbi:PadR family transcriptional regulator [Paenibacillus sp. y28]|uniref:PadR family transcriptional regulator n=1 Tax=Paenibacillus sp. y28 TaxID=3129110 RepID=UPI00301658D5
MNTLGFGLLGLLTQGPCSGYDLMLKMEPIWKAQHSQIYPLLAKMEQEGFVVHELQPQTEKPDKKIYTITDTGREALLAWLPEPPDERAGRDEMIIKAQSIWLIGPEAGRALFTNREAVYRDRIRYYQELLDKHHQGGVQPPSPSSPDFGSYILLKRYMGVFTWQMEWCRWVLSLLDEQAE